MHRRRFLAGAAIPLAASCAPSRRTSTLVTTADEWGLSGAEAARVPELLRLASVPGAQVAVANGGRTTQELAFGLRDAAAGLPMETSTVAPAASLGKPVFAYAVLRLVAEGKLELDAPLERYGTFASLGADLARTVTARKILTHTTGFPNWRREAGPLVANPDRAGKFSYSGEGFYLLSQVVEQVTASPIERAMERLVFQPLGMTSSSYSWRPDLAAYFSLGHGFDGSVASGYRDMLTGAAGVESRIGKAMADWTSEDATRAVTLASDGKTVAVPNNVVPNVAGSLLTTPGDYLRFLAGAVFAGGAQALPASLRAEMLRSQVTLNERLSWGLGWGLERRDDASFVWHWGDNGVYKNFVVANPERGDAAVVFTNGYIGYKAYERLIQRATGRDPAGLLWRQVG